MVNLRGHFCFFLGPETYNVLLLQCMLFSICLCVLPCPFSSQSLWNVSHYSQAIKRLSCLVRFQARDHFFNKNAVYLPHNQVDVVYLPIGGQIHAAAVTLNSAISGTLSHCTHSS